MSSKKLYSDYRWYGSPKDWKLVKEATLTPEEERKHQEFLKKLRELWNLDDKGKSKL